MLLTCVDAQALIGAAAANSTLIKHRPITKRRDGGTNPGIAHITNFANIANINHRASPLVFLGTGGRLTS